MKRDGGEDGGLPGGSGTVIHRLTSVQDGRLGKLLNQLQILGVEKMHLDRIKAQLQSALGDDSGKKFRILQQAVEQLVRDKSLGRELATAADEGEDDAKPHDIERLVACVFASLCCPHRLPGVLAMRIYSYISRSNQAARISCTRTQMTTVRVRPYL